MDRNCYIYHELSNDDTYNPILTGVEVELQPLNDIYKVRGRNDFPFTKVRIPQKVYSLLKELLNHHDLSDSLNDFISLLVYCQYHYFFAKQEVITPMLEDFIYESKELGALMEILGEYLFASNYNYLNTVSFRFKGRRKAVTIDNIFIVKEIYQSIINEYGLTKENFEERKRKILSASKVENTKNITKPAKSFKKEVIRTIYQCLSDKNLSLSDSDKLKFIGVFLSLCQIKDNDRNKTLYIFDSLKDAMGDVDIKNLRHYITRE